MAFYRVIRSQIFRVLMAIFGKITQLLYNKDTLFSIYICSYFSYLFVYLFVIYCKLFTKQNHTCPLESPALCPRSGYNYQIRYVTLNDSFLNVRISRMKIIFSSVSL